MNTQIKLNDIADELLILNKHTIDALFRLDNCAECIALYVFYYKTAKWQKTNLIRATDNYVKQSLKWGIDKIRKTKAILKENGLIDIVQRRENGKIGGWYISVHYLVSKRSIDDIKILVDSNNTQNQEVESKNTQKQQVVEPTSGSQETNALRYNNKCLKIEDNLLKDNNNSILNKSQIMSEFEQLWKLYPKKQGKDRAIKSYIKARKEGVEYSAVEKGIKDYIENIKREKTEERFIKQGGTWFYQRCWEDEYNVSLQPRRDDLDDIL